MPTETETPQAATDKTTVKRHAPRKASVAGRKAATSASKEVAPRSTGTDLAKRKPTGISDQWFDMTQTGQQTAFDVIRKFVEIVDMTVPAIGGDTSRRRKLIEGAIDVADLAARAQLGMMRGAGAQLGMMRGAVQNAVLVNVGVDVDVNAFNGVDVAVPTDVGAFNAKDARPL